jgi:hypothetical protein
MISVEVERSPVPELLSLIWRVEHLEGFLEEAMYSAETEVTWQDGDGELWGVWKHSRVVQNLRGRQNLVNTLTQKDC